MRSLDPAPSRQKRRRATIWCVTGLLLIGGTAVGYTLFARDGEPDCDGLLADKSIQRVLDERHHSDMSCGDLGAALHDAVTGKTPGRHTLAEAENTRSMIVAISEDIEERRDSAIAPALRRPIASALADYAGDTHAILSFKPDYQDWVHRAPWRDRSVVRMPAAVVDVVRVMRAASDDPSAYATLRSAQTHECATHLADVPAKATGDSLSPPARDCASSLGFLDGIAEDIPQDERRKWRADVIARLAASSPKPPSYREDAVGHVTGSWRRGLAEAEPGDTGFVEDDIANLITIWAVGRGADPDSEEIDLLKKDARDDASSSTVKTEEAMKCLRQPKGQPCL